MNTLKNLMNQVWCLCTEEPEHPVAPTPAADSLWQWYRSRNAALAERGAEMPPAEQTVKRLRVHF